MKNYKRYSIEFLLVFLSIIGAFLFEDWRVQREENGNYLSTLKEFQYDLQQNIDVFRQEVDSVDDVPLSGRRLRDKARIERILMTYSEGNFNESLIVTVVYFGLIGNTWDPGITQSEQYRRIIENHYYRVKSPQLKEIILEYGRSIDARKALLEMERARFNKIESLVHESFQIHHSLDTLRFFHFYGDDFVVKGDGSYSRSTTYQPILSKRNREIFAEKQFMFHNYIRELDKLTDGIVAIHEELINYQLSQIDSLITVEFSLWD